MSEIKVGSMIEYRKPGAVAKTGRVEWVYMDGHRHEPFYRVRPDIGRRAMVYIEDIERAAKPYRKRK